MNDLNLQASSQPKRRNRLVKRPERIWMRMPPDAKAILRQAALAQNTTMSDVVLRLIWDFQAAQKGRLPL